MPVIGISVERLNKLIKCEIERNQLIKYLEELGCDVEGYSKNKRFKCKSCNNIMEVTQTEDAPSLCDRCGFDFEKDSTFLIPSGEVETIRMELLAVRPDMFEPGGLARTIRGYLDIEHGSPKYKIDPPKYNVYVNKNLATSECFRPFIACAVVKNLELDDTLVRIIMKLQENLHWAMGRDRKLMAIGVHNFDVIKAPFYYEAVDIDGIKFFPLGFPNNLMTPKEVLENHPKGKDYAHLLINFTKYPLLTDSTKAVLSMPPIINSELTKVKHSTNNFFIDVTGIEERIVNKALNVIVSSLIELEPSVTVEAVNIVYEDATKITPDFTPQEMKICIKNVSETIGVNFTQEDVIKHLKRMRHDILEVLNEDELIVSIPAYRNDILHERDLIEDIAISYGYHNISPAIIPTMTIGSKDKFDKSKWICRETLIGLGFFEIITLLLTKPEKNFDFLKIPRKNCVTIANPIHIDQTIVRTNLIFGLLETFEYNLSNDLPQKIFEIGNISYIDEAAETGALEELRLSAGIIGPKTGYSEIKSVLEALLRELGVSFTIKPLNYPTFIESRGAEVFIEKDSYLKSIGIIGEVHPEVLENFHLIYPVSLFEIVIP